MLYIQDAPETVTITATGEVLTSDAHGVVRGTTETLPPALFLRATPRRPPMRRLPPLPRKRYAARTAVLRRSMR